MYWNNLNKDNIEIVKDYYYDYLEENKKDKYTSQLKSLEEFMEDELILCKRCENPILWENSKESFNYGRICEECYEKLYTEPEEPDNYEEYKLREEGLL